MKTPTIYEIKRQVIDAPYFFSRDTMRFFGQSMSDFHVNKTEKEHIFYVWAKYGNNCPNGKTERYYNTKTRKLYFTFADALGGE